MSLQTVTDHHKSLIASALSQSAMGDEYEWDLCLTMTEQGPVFMVMVYIPSPVLGDRLINMAGFPFAAVLEKENADELARGLFEMLRQQRTKIIQEMLNPPVGQPDLSAFTGPKP